MAAVMSPKQRSLFLRAIAFALLVASIGLVVNVEVFSKKPRSQKETGLREDREVMASGRNRKPRQSRGSQGRSLQVLLAEIENSGMRIGDLIDQWLNSSVCDEFSVSLTSQEVLTLAGYFRGEIREELNRTLRPRIMKRWGKLNPTAALKSIVGYEDVDLEDAANVYKGWAEIAPGKALEHYRLYLSNEDSVLKLERLFTDILQNSLQASVNSALYSELAKKDIELALKELNARNEPKSEAIEDIHLAAPLIVSRDAVYQHLPQDSQWFEIAEANLSLTFANTGLEAISLGHDMIGGDLVRSIEYGAGPIFYSKWLKESPTEASVWIRENDSKQLTKAWAHKLLLDTTNNEESNAEAQQILTEEEFEVVKFKIAMSRSHGL